MLKKMVCSAASAAALVCLISVFYATLALAVDSTLSYEDQLRQECVDLNYTWTNGSEGEGCYDEAGRRYYTESEAENDPEALVSTYKKPTANETDSDWGGVDDTTEREDEASTDGYDRGRISTDPCVNGEGSSQSQGSSSRHARSGYMDHDPSDEYERQEDGRSSEDNGTDSRESASGNTSTDSETDCDEDSTDSSNSSNDKEGCEEPEQAAGGMLILVIPQVLVRHDGTIASTPPTFYNLSDSVWKGIKDSFGGRSGLESSAGDYYKMGQGIRVIEQPKASLQGAISSAVSNGRPYPVFSDITSASTTSRAGATVVPCFPNDLVHVGGNASVTYSEQDDK